MLLEETKSTLLLIDMQERLLPAMAGGDEVRRRCSILLKAAKALNLPVTVSEQYPRGLGHTVPALKAEIGNAPVFAKLAFSGWRDAALKAHFIDHHEQGRPLVIIAGIEAHVCVLQTAVDLAAAGFGVFAVATTARPCASASCSWSSQRPSMRSRVRVACPQGHGAGRSTSTSSSR